MGDRKEELNYTELDDAIAEDISDEMVDKFNTLVNDLSQGLPTEI